MGIAVTTSRRKRFRVVLIDDDAMTRAAVSGFLEAAGLEVVAEASSGNRGIAVVRELEPDLALIDLLMPGMPGTNVIRILSEQTPEVRLVVLTGSAAEADVYEAFRAGAVGYISKDAGSDEISRAVRAAAEGHPYVSAGAASHLIELARVAVAPARAAAIRALLTNREVEILRMLANGESDAAIAARLNLSVHTVKSHVAHLLRKLELENRTQLAVQAVRSGVA